MFASISSNKPGDNKPETDVVAIGIIASVPSEDSIVLAPVVPLILKSVVTFVFFAVFASISSNKPGDNKPETDVVAIGIIASVPSEDSIVLAPVVPLILKSVVNQKLMLLQLV